MNRNIKAEMEKALKLFFKVSYDFNLKPTNHEQEIKKRLKFKT